MNNITHSENSINKIMDDDGEDKDDSKRRTRNLSEKKRRDQFNMLVNELSAMISPNSKKMDKSTILKSTISFLKNHNEVTVRSKVHDIQAEWKPSFLSNEEFTYLVLEALEAFIMVLSTTGQICYVSESITTLLGHSIGDILNQNIFNFIYEDDRLQLYQILQDHTALGNSKGNEFTFKCHLKRGSLDFREEETYEYVQFSGFFRHNVESSNTAENVSCDEDIRILFICTGHLCTPQLIRDVSLVDANRNEFTSRHSLENFHFLFLDHRAPPIIGYLPLEVLGTSGFDYYHFDDLEKVVTCHEALMQKGELTSCYYRFLTKGQQWIWLQTRFYITYHQWNSKPEFVVCTHRVVSYADVHKNMKSNSAERSSPCEEPVLHNATDQQRDEAVTTVPSFIVDTSDQISSTNRSLSQPPSVKSASGTSTIDTSATVSTTAASAWPRPSFGGSDTTSISGNSKSSCKRSSQEIRKKETTQQVTTFMPQHTMTAAQYMNAPSYVGTVPIQGVPIQGVSIQGVSIQGVPIQGVPIRGVPVQGVPVQGVPIQGVPVPLHVQTLPLLVSPQENDVQEQLQRKHEQLQELIARQQEELRQVKEQLFLARLGMLPPEINVPNQYVHVDELSQHNQQQYNHVVPQAIIYEPSEDTPQYPPHQAQYPPHMPP